MAIRALNLHTTKKISHPDDKDEPTIFEIGAIDTRTLSKLNDAALVVGMDPNQPDAEADVKLANKTLAFETVQFGLRGWENLRDDKGDIKFETESRVIGAKKYEIAKGDLVSLIPEDVVQWLSDEIKKLNNVSKTEAGN